MIVEEMTMAELIELKRKTELAIFHNSDYKFYKKTQEERKHYLTVYGKELINYINQELGYNIMGRKRNPRYTFPRYCIFYYLRSEGLTFPAIAEIFNYHHSSIIHGINTYENLLKFRDAEFGYYHLKINHLITKFKKNETNNIK